MTITQTMLKQYGFESNDAKNIMAKIFSVGAKRTNVRVDITYAKRGKVIHQIAWQAGAVVSDAIKALGEYIEKTPYSNRVNLSKWESVVSLLRSIEAKAA